MSRWFAAACLGLSGALALSACDTGPGKEVTDFASTLGKDTCGAISHQYLVGRSVAHLNVTELPRNTRVVPAGTSPGTSKQEKRMTVIIGGGDQVTRVYCG
jgi:hypothetical protein